MNISPLLPLQALVVTLEFTGEAWFSPLHQAAVHAFVRHLVDSPEGFDTLVTLDAPESGRLHYMVGDRYRFVVYALPAGEILLARLIARLRALPDSSKVSDRDVPLRNNLRLDALTDLFSGEAVQGIADLTRYDRGRLASEATVWAKSPYVRIRWLSPARLLREKERREDAKGEARYCRDGMHLSASLFLQRLHDGIADLLRRRGQVVEARAAPPEIGGHPTRLFWLDGDYRNVAGKGQPMGGIAGLMDLGSLDGVPMQWVEMLVLGQYLGVGQRRAFGLGRYRLETPGDRPTLREVSRAESLLIPVIRPDNLQEAYEVIRENQQQKNRKRQEGSPALSLDGPTAAEQEMLAEQIERVGAVMGRTEDRPPALTGWVEQEDDGGLRAFAVPPFWDRVAQRAVTQVINPLLDRILHPGSHGYRRGRSRHTAGADIHQAWKEGYRWIYEADIDDFFDTVDWDSLEVRLRALFRDDPVVDKLLNWVKAPVDYQGQIIQRRRGLPQGAPISPPCANLLLDDFDRDIEAAGFRLVRYADDFVVLCKDRAEAEAAAIEVRRSLAEIGLNLNEEKSGVVSFERGFRYLGLLFTNGLVLDVGGEKGQERPIQSNPVPPPHSWLAHLAARQPRALEPWGAGPTPVDGQETEDREPASEGTAGPLRLGDCDDFGALAIVTGPPALISTGGGRISAERDGDNLFEIPWSGLGAVLLVGAHHVTTPALTESFRHDVPIHFAGANGQYHGVTWSGGPGPGGAGLWLRQAEVFGDVEQSLMLSRKLVAARLRHQREVLRQRDPRGFVGARDQIQRAIYQAMNATALDSLKGVEGAATRAYFQSLATILPSEFGFDGRNRRPPRDPFNALLSLGYTQLYGYTETLLRVAGLYPWHGFYHQSHGSHAALASDLMEPFRHLVERTALSAITRGRLSTSDFALHPEHGCRLGSKALKTYLHLLAERFHTAIHAAGEDEPLTLPHHLHRQNLRLVGSLRDGTEFRPWIAR